MRALWLEDRRLSVRDTPTPEPPPGEALVRVVRAGICNTDIELTRGYYRFTGIPGHEFVGIVERGPDALLGRRVVGEINAVCGSCRACASGRRTHCECRTVLGIAGRNGAFADYLTLPAENLHPVPDAVPTDAAVFTEPLAAALEVQEQVRLQAVECTGNPEGFAVAQRALRPRGTLVLKSTYAGALTLDASAVVVNELTVVGSRCGPFPPALRLLAEGRVAVQPLIHARYPLGEAPAAFAHAQRPGVLKVLLEIAR